MLDYDSEARRYDGSRGGEARGRSAARAVSALIPPGARTVADIGCGTGIVTRHLPGPGRRVIGIDRSPGMAGMAVGRLPGQITVGTAVRLPLAAGSVDVVTMVWLLHLLGDDGSAAAVGEAARVLRSGGTLITTVGKNQSDWAAGSDVAALMAPAQAEFARPPADRRERVISLAAGHGLRPAGDLTFTGTGQGRSPGHWREGLLTQRIRWARRATPDRLAGLCAALAALPDPDLPRPDPVYRVIALRMA